MDPEKPLRRQIERYRATPGEERFRLARELHPFACLAVREGIPPGRPRTKWRNTCTAAGFAWPTSSGLLPPNSPARTPPNFYPPGKDQDKFLPFTGKCSLTSF
ncbi:MAG TPA: hypothetical protein PK777_04480 [Thermoguttaceae bacterium]|nr:hypothetical protein [Thermoguttaceae bacterium]HPP52187.1 hypothetical protein [Thermoguttaceae bacterium]